VGHRSHYTESNVEKRTYSNTELKQIIDIALRLGNRETRNPTATQGQSIEDVVAIGRELGISDELIRRAAGEMESKKSRGFQARVFGGIMIQEERLELDQSIDLVRLEELSVELRRITGLPGQASMVGRRLSWQSSYMASQQRAWALSVSIVAGDENTVVKFESRNGYLAGGLFGGLIGGIGVGLGIGVGIGVGVGELGSTLFATLVPIACLGGSYLLARAVFSIITRARRRKVQRMVERVREFLTE
jgi:hypothetical protein